MYCPKCGEKNDDNAVFCAKCGCRLKEEGEDLSSFETADLSGQETKVYGGRSNTMDTQVYDDLDDVRSQMSGKSGFSLRSIRRSDLISILVAVVAVIACVILFFALYGAKPVAQRYAEAVLGRDWSTVYDCISHDTKGDFLNKENFVTAETVGSYENTASYSITGITVGTDDLNSKTYSVTYKAADADESNTMTVSLRRNGLFWEVDNADYVVDAYAISVPAGATVSVDKVKLSGKYKSGSNSSRDFYTISPIYGNTHYVEISGDGLTETAQIVSCFSSDPVEVEVGLDENTATDIAQRAESDLQAILEAAARNQKISSVSVINNMSGDTKEDATYEYEYVRDTVFGYQDNHMELTSYQLSDMEACVYTLQNTDGRDFLQVDIRGNSVLEYNKVNYLLGNGAQTTTGTCTCTMYYVKNGTSWLLYSIDLNL